MGTERYEIRNRYTNEVQFACDVKTIAREPAKKKLGRAVLKAVEARANLTDANLTGANLTGAYLAGANLTDANLTDANLAGAYLAGAYLTGAYLADANLTGAYLAGANLTDANLTDANLTGANLTGAYLAGAYLTGANLTGAYLTSAYLTGAYLTGANLTGAYLTGANLTDAKHSELAIAMTRILPDGDLIGWKKCHDGVIVKLRIPAEAKRSHAFGRKCRAQFADVLEVTGAEFGVSQHDGKTEYRAGQRVTPDAFCEDWTQECASGVHFFTQRIEAENY